MIQEEVYGIFFAPVLLQLSLHLTSDLQVPLGGLIPILLYLLLFISILVGELATPENEQEECSRFFSTSAIHLGQIFEDEILDFLITAGEFFQYHLEVKVLNERAPLEVQILITHRRIFRWLLNDTLNECFNGHLVFHDNLIFKSSRSPSRNFLLRLDLSLVQWWLLSSLDVTGGIDLIRRINLHSRINLLGSNDRLGSSDLLLWFLGCDFGLDTDLL